MEEMAIDRSIRAALLALLFVAGPARAHLHLVADEPQASLVWWTPAVHGALGASAAGASAGATYDDPNTSSLGATLSLHAIGAVCLDFDYTSIHTDAPVTAQAAFTFRNQTFGVSGQAGRLSYDMPIFGFGLRYIAFQNKYGSVGVIGTVKIVKPAVQLDVAGQRAAFDLTLPVPMAGLSGQFNFSDWAHAFGSYKMLHLGLAAIDAQIDDWEAGVFFDPHAKNMVGLRGAVGYRKLDIDIASGGAGDIRFTPRRGGPFLELAVTF